MTTTTTYTLVDAANDLAGMALIEKRMKEDLAAHQGSIQEQRDLMHQMMRDNGVDKVTAEGAVISRRHGKRVTIVDPEEMTAALKERGLYETCLAEPRLDLAKAKRVAEMSAMPGVERIEYDELAVKLA